MSASPQALLLLRDARAPLQYSRPSFFALRIFALICLLSLTTVCTSLFFFVVPGTLKKFYFDFLLTSFDYYYHWKFCTFISFLSLFAVYFLVKSCQKIYFNLKYSMYSPFYSMPRKISRCLFVGTH